MPRLALKIDPGAEVQDLHRQGDRWETLLDRSARPLETARTVIPGLVAVNLLLGFFNNRPQPAVDAGRGVYLWLDGEIWDRASALERAGIPKGDSPADPELCLQLYLRHGDCFCEQLNGQFVVAIYDSNRSRLLVCNDRYAMRSLFWRQQGGRFACGSELKAVLAAWESTRIDPIGLMQLFAYGRPLGTRTLFQGVEALPPASRLVFERGVVRVDQYWEFRFSEHPSEAPEADLAAELAGRLHTAGARQTGGSGRVGLALNGDLGSRVLLETRAAANDPLTCAYSIGYSSSGDDAADRRLAERFGLRHLFLVPSSGALATVAPEIVWRSEGSFRFEKACALQFHSRLRPELDIILTSEIGSPLCAPDLGAGSRSPTLWDPRSAVGPGAQAAAEDVRALCSRRVWSDGWEPSWISRVGTPPGVASRPEDPRDAEVERWMRLGLPHDLLQAGQTARNDFEVRVPMLDYDLVDFTARLPGRYREGQRLLRLALARALPRASSPGAGPMRRAESMQVPADGLSFRRVLEFVPGLGRGGAVCGWRVPDLNTELRRDPAFQCEILEPFLQSDHFPDEVLDRSAARRLLAEHRNGERDHTALLGAMVTVALVYQQFVVRGLQAPAAPRGYPEPIPALEAA